MCEAHVNGWKTVVPAGSDHDRWLTYHSNRHFKRKIVGKMAEYVFPAGQTCFRGEAGQHKVSLSRPLILTTSLTGRPKQVLEPNQFVDNMGEHLIRLKRRIG